jgi:riboflavin kinase/FMN adenylyltransferase
MKLTNTIKSIAIGSFDGIHLAHQELISQVEAVVIIERNQATLSHGYKRVEHINKPSFFYHFEQISSISAKEFIDRIKNDFPQLEKIVVGYDFAFGYKKEGNTSMLKELFNREVVVVKEVKYRGISIHSCIIRKAISKGNLSIANRLLDRNYKIYGEIIKGQGLGKKELVPTLNLNVQNYILPKDGVYATRTLVNNSWLRSVSFLGHRATVDGSFAIETHIINQDIGEIIGGLEIEFIEFIRANRKFNSLAELKEQIEKDIDRAKIIEV